MFNLFNNDYDEFTIKIKGLISLNEENPNKVLIKKEYFDGNYDVIVNTLFHYAALAYLACEEKPTRKGFNDWANKTYINTVSGGNINEE